jgi:hypothetical protein
MTEDTAAAGGGSRVIALVLGKTGIHMSVDGSEPTPLALNAHSGKPAALTIESLLDALDPLILADHTIDVLLIGTRPDGTPGWHQFDIQEANAASPDNVHFTAQSEAQALHESYMASTNPGDFLVYSLSNGEFTLGTDAIAHTDPESPNINAYFIFATIVENGRPKGSVRCWKQGENGRAELSGVWYVDIPFGQIYTLSGTSITDDPIVVAGLIESYLRANLNVSRVFVWDQDGLAKKSAYLQGGKFWSSLRPPADFAANDGKFVIVGTALSVAKLSSAPRKPPVTEAVADEPVGEDKDGA